jgi:thymidylate synthase ThyX
MYKCEILADSLNPQGDRLITMKVTFPRIVLAEFNTHRMFSRNSASSRAIPFEKLLKSVEENPFIPIAWQKEHKGMQGSEYWTEEDKVRIDIGNEFEYIEDIQPITEEFKIRWLEARDKAVNIAIGMNDLGVTKQLCNRLLEPFMWHTVLVTANESAFNHFFELRCPLYRSPVDKYFLHKSKKECIANHSNPVNVNLLNKFSTIDWLNINESQADIHIQAIAELMYDSVKESKPRQLKSGEWHFPYHKEEDVKYLLKLAHSELTKHNKELSPTACDLQPIVDKLALKVSTARAARISYETLGANPKIDYEADIRLHDSLIKSKHWSPFEHCARVMSNEEYSQFGSSTPYDSELEREGVLYVADYQHTDIHCSFNQGHCRNFKGFIQYRHLIENQ